MAEHDDIRIRPAVEKDIDNVVKLAEDMVANSVSPFRDANLEEVKAYRRKDLELLKFSIKNPSIGIFIAETPAGEFLGHVIIVTGQMESTTGEKQAWVFDLSVKPDRWRSGIGKILMAHAEEFARKRKMKYIGLRVTSCNEQALKFYLNQGFAEERKDMVKVL